MSAATVALFDNGQQLTDVKTVHVGRGVDVLFDITSQFWPVTVNQVGVWSETGFALVDAPIEREYAGPGRYNLVLNPPFAYSGSS